MTYAQLLQELQKMTPFELACNVLVETDLPLLAEAHGIVRIDVTTHDHGTVADHPVIALK